MKQLSCGDGFNRGDSSACRADKVKEDVIEGYKIMSGLEKMNREGDSGSSDPRTREVSNKPANGMWDRNKMRYSALSVHYSFGAWTMRCSRYFGVFWWFQNVTVQSNGRKILQGLPSTESLLGCHMALLLSAHPALAHRSQWDPGQHRALAWHSTGIFVFP